MRTSKFTPEQMVAICRQGESGVPVVGTRRFRWVRTDAGKPSRHEGSWLVQDTSIRAAA